MLINPGLEWPYENKDGTYTHLGLECMRKNDVAIMRASAMKIAVVITDGLSKKPEMTKKESDKLKKEVDLVFGVYLKGITKGIDDDAKD